jgi:serine/threonine-protein kinase RsbW
MTGPGPDRAEPELEMEFPRKPEFVRTVRQAVAALARLHGAGDDVVEDIKLAVSEACNTAVRPTGQRGTSPVGLLARGGPEGLVVEMSDTDAKLAHPVAGAPGEISTGDLPFEQALALPIIRGLASEVALAARPEGGVVMRMVLALEPDATPGADGGDPVESDGNAPG